MGKILVVSIFIFYFTASAFCFRPFIEGQDYTVEFQEKSPETAATLHINFIDVVPESQEAEKIVKKQLQIFGDKLVSRNKVIHTIKKETKYKNIIGSAWYKNNADSANPIKIKFQPDFSAYVWIGKTKNIVPFPDYMSFLKK
ncbi:MAG: hypothetical protein LBL16_01135, partial [Endomicrobium sp.]|nr:hypothetical protein [Endomicrobium sp.]